MPSKKKARKLSAIDMRSSRYGVPLITLRDPQDVVSEQFRVLRANIDFAASSINHFQTVLFTSSEMSDGKSTVAQNLAVTWAQTGKRVLLVDADFRRPTIHKTFGLTNDRGLTTVLAMNDQPADVINTSELSKLFIMTSGPMPPNPSELLASDKMVQIIDWMRRNFDLVVIDSTPLLLVPDAQSLIPRSDGIVLVATLGKTKKKSLASAMHILNLARAHVLGLVSRDPERTDKAYGYGYGMGYTSTNKAADLDMDRASKALVHRNVPNHNQSSSTKNTSIKSAVPRGPQTAPVKQAASVWSSFGNTNRGAARQTKTPPAPDSSTIVKEATAIVPLVDIHTHLLPNTEQGPRSIDESLMAAKAAVSDNIRTLVVTPYQQADKAMNKADDIQSAILALRNTVKEAHIPINILAEQTVALSANLLAAFDSGDLLTVADSKKYLLVELPEDQVPDITTDVILQLKVRGVTMIIAHPETNQAILNDPKHLNRLLEQGAILQVSAASINGRFGKEIAAFTFDLVRRGFAATVAGGADTSEMNQQYHLSDAYAALTRSIGRSETDILKKNAIRIISGLPIDSRTVQEF
ncbi:MAG: polysaccharide biosynthesis tyrosine autokinase [Oenococcus sp.]|uniref:polysaccharide biosynthesis tyrosine autokinase n=1 Tax=Oenococcus sp. TaxID=1979414 RepID=UPI0039E9A212